MDMSRMVPLLNAPTKDTVKASRHDNRARCCARVLFPPMSKEFRMPDIGEGLTEAEILKWFVDVGTTVEVDQTLVEVETAKTVVEIPSPFAGTITSIHFHEGEIVEVGEILFIVDGAAVDPKVDPASDPEPAEKVSTPRKPRRASGRARLTLWQDILTPKSMQNFSNEDFF